jgi:pimeloyl-ACP methyl ester carboxylesterase
MSTPRPPPHFILVPGAFCPSHYFHKVIALLSPTHTVTAVDLPSMSASLRAQKTPAGLYADAEHVRNIARVSLDQGHDVVLVGSSYGAAVCMEACKSLTGRAEGQARIIHIIALCSIMADVGFTIADLVGGNLPIETGSSSPTYHETMDPSVAGALLCGSLPKSEQDEYTAMGKAICAKAFAEPLTFAAWKEVPMTLVVAGADMVLPVEKQVEYFEKAVELGAKEASMVRVEGGDHLVMLSHAEEVTRVCKEVGGM